MPRISTLAILLIISVLLFIRLSYLDWSTPTVTKTLTWDAFGYYMYLPGQFIYHDIGELKWLPKILEIYNPTGTLYQVSLLPNGNYAMKYLLGLSILYAPFFFLGHWIAGWTGYPQDGFSAPYQLAICVAALCYSLLGLWMLRSVLRRFFSETVTAITLLLVALATNYPQYVSADSSLTHGFLFTVYAVALFAILRWHEQPSVKWAFIIGGIIGLASITRPTEGIMLFLALLWQFPSQPKWAFLRQNKTQLAAACVGGFLGILPQLIYWKTVTGRWVYDVGAKFLFFRPHWQVLFGWEKGWFIYTPVTILMIAGLWMLRPYPFRRAVQTFVFLNIWIIIAWSDWRYGASYSCRALVQSYPVLSLPLAVVVQKCWESRARYPGLLLAVYLIGVNLLQIWQYNRTILHYNDMNRRYYQAIYLNPQPAPLAMSLLDTRDMLTDESMLKNTQVMQFDSTFYLNAGSQPKTTILERPLSALNTYQTGHEYWLRITAQVKSDWGAFDTNLITLVSAGAQQKRTNCRMQNGICSLTDWNTIDYYFRIPPEMPADAVLSIFAETTTQQNILIKDVAVKILEKNN